MAKKYIDAEKLIHDLEERIFAYSEGYAAGDDCRKDAIETLLKDVKYQLSLQQMPNSTQLIAEWEKEKAILEQKDLRGDAYRMAYNAFLDGFIKGLGYEGTK